MRSTRGAQQSDRELADCYLKHGEDETAEKHKRPHPSRKRRRTTTAAPTKRTGKTALSRPSSGDAVEDGFELTAPSQEDDGTGATPLRPRTRSRTRSLGIRLHSPWRWVDPAPPSPVDLTRDDGDEEGKDQDDTQPLFPLTLRQPRASVPLAPSMPLHLLSEPSAAQLPPNHRQFGAEADGQQSASRKRRLTHAAQSQALTRVAAPSPPPPALGRTKSEPRTASVPFNALWPARKPYGGFTSTATHYDVHSTAPRASPPPLPRKHTVTTPMAAAGSVAAATAPQSSPERPALPPPSASLHPAASPRVPLGSLTGSSQNERAALTAMIGAGTAALLKGSAAAQRKAKKTPNKAQLNADLKNGIRGAKRVR